MAKTVRFCEMEEGDVYREFAAPGENGADIPDPNAPALTLVGDKIQFVELAFHTKYVGWWVVKEAPEDYKPPYRVVKVGELFV